MGLGPVCARAGHHRCVQGGGNQAWPKTPRQPRDMEQTAFGGRVTRVSTDTHTHVTHTHLGPCTPTLLAPGLTLTDAQVAAAARQQLLPLRLLVEVLADSHVAAAEQPFSDLVYRVVTGRVSARQHTALGASSPLWLLAQAFQVGLTGSQALHLCTLVLGGGGMPAPQGGAPIFTSDTLPHSLYVPHPRPLHRGPMRSCKSRV